VVLLAGALASFANAQTTLKTCSAGGTETLAQIRDQNTDLKVVGTCYVNGIIDTGRASPLWVFHNVNLVSGGALISQEGKPIDFYAIREERGFEKITATLSLHNWLYPTAAPALSCSRTRRLTW
jgi:hypothetical protein